MAREPGGPRVRAEAGPKIPRLEWKSTDSLEVVVERVRRIQERLFPKFIFSEEEDLNEVFRRMYAKDVLSGANLGAYQHHLPAYFFAKQAIDRPMLVGLKAGKTLLSVGAGNALLERFLAQVLRLPSTQITCADKFSYPEALDNTVSTTAVDIMGSWEGAKEKYDHIIFPESFTIVLSQLYMEGHDRSDRDLHEEGTMVDWLGEVQGGALDQLKASDIETFKQRYGRFTDCQATAKVFDQAWRRLNPNGQLRFIGATHTVNQSGNDIPRPVYVYGLLHLLQQGQSLRLDASRRNVLILEKVT